MKRFSAIPATDWCGIEVFDAEQREVARFHVIRQGASSKLAGKLILFEYYGNGNRDWPFAFVGEQGEIHLWSKYRDNAHAQRNREILVNFERFQAKGFRFDIFNREPLDGAAFLEQREPAR